MHLAVVCPHVLQLRLTIGTPTDGLLYAALTSATERVHTQLHDGERPFEGADVVVVLSCLAEPGQLRKRSAVRQLTDPSKSN